MLQVVSSVVPVDMLRQTHTNSISQAVNPQSDGRIAALSIYCAIKTATRQGRHSDQDKTS